MKESRAFIIALAVLLTSVGTLSSRQFTPLPPADQEAILLTLVKGAARNESGLRLHTDAGPVTFENRAESGEGAAAFYLAGHSDRPHPFYLIRFIGHESHGYRLAFKKTGQILELYGIPHFSPDRRRLIDTSLDLEAGHMPNLIRLYMLKDDTFAEEWKLVYPGAKGPAHPVWLDNNTVVFFEVAYQGRIGTANLIKKPFILEWKEQKWHQPRPLK